MRNRIVHFIRYWLRQRASKLRHLRNDDMHVTSSPYSVNEICCPHSRRRIGGGRRVGRLCVLACHVAAGDLATCTYIKIDLGAAFHHNTA
jgi:hypothetical protein